MEWRRWRDRWLGDPVRRRRIERWPVGRRIARRHAERLFGVVAGFAQSQVLLAAVDLGVFAALRAGPRRWDEVVDLPPMGAGALRQALLATGLVEARGSKTGLTVDGLVVATDPGLLAMIAHNRLLYADLADPVATLRGEGGGRIAALWPYGGGGGEPEQYGALMAASLGMVAEAVLAAVDFRPSRRIMDVGGGRGGFLARIAPRCPDAALILVDLPAATAGLALAERRIEVHGVAPGAALPVADTITLLRVLHDQDDDAAAALMARVATALETGGRVVVAEPVARRGRDPQTAYFASYFAAMRSGRLRTRHEIEALLRGAGMRRVRWRADVLVDVAIATA